MKLIRNLPPIKDQKGRWISIGEFLCPNPVCNNKVIKRLDHGLRDKSCGCMRNKLIANALKGNKNNYKHGEGHLGTKLYHVWDNIKSRCLNSNSKSYKDYGGRGITICPEWINDYTKFRDWSLDNGYQEGLEIDRIDNNGNYNPKNCRWITSMINTQNRRSTKLSLEIANEIRRLYNTGYYTQLDLAKKFNVIQQTISDIVNHKRWKN